MFSLKVRTERLRQHSSRCDARHRCLRHLPSRLHRLPQTLPASAERVGDSTGRARPVEAVLSGQRRAFERKLDQTAECSYNAATCVKASLTVTLMDPLLLLSAWHRALTYTHKTRKAPGSPAPGIFVGPSLKIVCDHVQVFRSQQPPSGSRQSSSLRRPIESGTQD